MEKSELETEISEVCDFIQDKNENSKKKFRFMSIPRVFHNWTFSEYCEAKTSGAINANYKLKYTLGELEDFIIETDDKFKYKHK